MNKRILFAITIFGILISACSTDLDVTGKYEDYTIVYGILQEDDSIHQFKITKAFLGEANANDMAQIPDSSYYDYNEIEVVFEEWRDGSKTNSIKLDTGFIRNKENGIFYGPEQMIYENKTPFHLSGACTYKLIINNLKSGKVTSCEIPFVERKINKLSEPYAFVQGFLDMTRPSNRVGWYAFDNAKIYYLKLRFYYIEIEDNDTTENYFDWELGSKIATESDYELKFGFTPNMIYQKMLEQIPQKENVVRYPGSVRDHTNQMRFYVEGFDRYYYTYKELSSGNNDQFSVRPDYSNIDNGLGLVFSKTKLYGKYQLSEYAMEELLTGNTQVLNFRNW